MSDFIDNDFTEDFNESVDDAIKTAENANTSEIQKTWAQYQQIKRRNARENRKKEQDRSFINQARRWLNAVSYSEFEDAICNRVMGQNGIKTLTACIYNHIECLVGKIPTNTNVLIAAPSGSGKTESFRAIRDYFKKHIPSLPVCQIDMTSITEEGFKGKNTADVVRPLLATEGCKGEGLVFLDEIDKKMIPSYTSSGSNVNQAVMSQLLTLIEGTVIEEKCSSIDSSLTMFIGLGSFDVCRKSRSKKEAVLGFGNTVTKANEQVDHFTPIRREDMLSLGANPEFIGRFTAVINYTTIPYEAVDKIIDSYLLKLEQRLKVKIAISDYMRRELHAVSNTKYGCRMIETKLTEAIMPIYGEILRHPSRYDLELRLEDYSNINLISQNATHSA